MVAAVIPNPNKRHQALLAAQLQPEVQTLAPDISCQSERQSMLMVRLS